MEKKQVCLCVYCGKELDPDHPACCGEIGHVEWADSDRTWRDYVDYDGSNEGD